MFGPVRPECRKVPPYNLLLLNRRQAAQQSPELLRREWCRLCEGRTRGAAVLVGLALAEREGRPLALDVLVDFVCDRFNRCI